MSKQASLRRWSPGLAALVVLLAAGSASAEDPGKRRYTAEGKLRLHLDTDLFSWTQVRPWYDPPDKPGAQNPRPDTNPHERTNIIGFGAARPLGIYSTDQSPGLFLTGSSQFALGVGYGVHRHVLIGARLGLSFDRVRDRSDAGDMNPDDFSVDRFFGAVFTPYIEILPLPEGRILPFILIRTGVAGTAHGTRVRTFTEIPGLPAVETDNLGRTSTISPTVGVGAGAHFFVIPQFSFDLGLNFDYRWVAFRTFQKDNVSGNTAKTDWSHISQGFSLGVNLGLSVWFL